MAVSTAGALKAVVEAWGLGLAVYRDGAPLDAAGHVAVPYPHVIVQEGIGYDTERHGDTDDPAGHQGTSELVQVTLIQRARALGPTGAPGAVVEDRQLGDHLRARLGRCTRELQQHAPWRVYGCRVQSALRSGPTDNLVRTIITVVIRRDSEGTTP